jgi:hypothetical protein
VEARFIGLREDETVESLDLQKTVGMIVTGHQGSEHVSLFVSRRGLMVMEGAEGSAEEKEGRKYVLVPKGTLWTTSS